tara:strand:+ start:27296 stop:29446 length:2151 start_codon:yes stop_codon:yes gene_type:complete
MPMTALKFRPGIISDITSYSNEGGFVDGDKVRFRFGFPEKFGGWEKYSTNQYLGSARRLHNWVALDGSDFMGIGTHLKYYIEEGQTFNDITPIRNTTGAGDITFAATNGSTTITVTDPAHGANEKDFVTFSGAATLGGTITATILNAEFQIASIISSNAYTITSSVAANSSDTGNGGSSVVGAYQLNVGLDVTVGGTGWGAGQWSGTTSGALATQLAEALDASETAIDVDSATGITAGDLILIEEELITVGTISSNTLGTGGGPSTRGASGTDAATHADNTLVRLATGNADSANDFVGWGNAASVTTPGAQIRLWSHDNFGEDIIINPRDGGLFYWDKTNGLGNRAVELSATSTYSGETSVPTVAKQVLVSDQDRHVIVFGCDGLGATSSATIGNGIQDPLLIRFSSQENPVDFFPTATNTAGDLRLGGGSTFVQAVETKQQILVFTNKTLHAMKFIGPPFTFGLQELSKNITIMSPFSAVAVEDAVYWMGVDTFYVYSGGQTIQLPCTVKDKVFLDFNFAERDKVHVGVNSEFSELLWFYPSSAGTQIDKYVAYNYLEKVWYYGTLARDAWIDRGIRNLPQATGNQYLYNHEVGFDDDGSAMTSFIESSSIDIGDGDKFVFLKQVIPDITFNGSTSVNPDVAFTMKSRNNPGANFNETTQGTAQRSATSPVEQFTEKLNYRLRGRSFALRIDSTSLGTKYKLGTPRVDIREDGRR